MSSHSAIAADKKPAPRTGIPSGVLGMIVFILVEVMFFAALISAYLIVKAGAVNWPPPDQPTLPAAATAFNTFALLASGVLAWTAGRTFAREKLSPKFVKQMMASILLGLFFLIAQGTEWVRLLSYGLTMKSSTYGAFFYLVIGAHGLHVLCAMLFMIYAWFKARKGIMKGSELWTAQVFWYFVVGVWPVLYILMYLN
jgi:heme/copper-type cytochrome/quinol oxidase subunit 3